MSLIKCSECGKEVSDKAKICPHCGNPIKTVSLVKCSECGKEVSNKAKVCPHCGNPIKPNITDTVAQHLMTGFNWAKDNQFSHLLTKYFSLTTRIIFGLLVLGFLFGTFYKLKNGSSTIHKPSLIQIFADPHPDLSRGIRDLASDIDDAIIQILTPSALSSDAVRNSKILNSKILLYLPFRACLINLLLVLILLFTKANKKLDYKLAYLISLMLIYSFVPLDTLSDFINSRLSSVQGGYSGFSISFSAVNRGEFLSLILLIYSMLLIIIDITNSSHQGFMQKIKDWIKSDTLIHSSLLILTGLYIIFGHLTYYLSLPFFIYLLVFRKFGLFQGKKA